MRKQNRTVAFICRGAVIAALYTVLTLVAAACGLSSGVIQFRISEALCILGVLTPAAIPGVTLGCMISNLLTGGAVWDVVFGTLASLVGMLVLRTLRKHPYIAPLPYVAANMIVVPLVLRYVYAAEGTIPYFVLTVGIGEVVCAWVLGVLLLLALRRSKADKLFEDKNTPDDQKHRHAKVCRTRPDKVREGQAPPVQI